MYLGERRNALYFFLIILLFFLWYSTLRKRNHTELELEVQLLQKHSSPADFHSCSTDSCLKLDRCLFDLDRIRVYVQPMVKIKYPNGKEMKVQKSQEFEQIRQAILSSEYVVDLPEKACLVLPGIDLLNLRKFKSVSEVQRVIESVSTLLPLNSNLLLFNFVGLRDPLHLKAIWASASLDQYTLRRKFDVSIPMIRPYSLGLSENHKINHTADQRWTVVLRFASDTVSSQLKEALKSVDSNVTLLYLSEIKETEKDVTVVKDQNGQQRDYVDVLKHSTFTLIHDLVPGFQMLILDAMEFGTIPVIISDDYLPPFHELLDWSRFAILLAKQNLQELPRILHSIQPDLISSMRQSVQRVYWRHLSSPHQMALSTLEVIERRILPVESSRYLNNVWAENEIGANNRLWLNVPIRSMASNFTIILAPPQQLDKFEHVIHQLRETTRSFLHSILVLWSVAERPPALHSLNARLQSELNVPIHYLNWNPVDLSSKMGSFVETIFHRSDASRDCWLFMDLRSRTKEAKFTQSLIEQAFAAFKENADSILSFDPYNENTQNKPIGDVENRKQSPFYHGAAFINPHAAEEIGKFSSNSEHWARCSKISSHRIDCKTEAKCPEFTMEFCRPTFV